jgi:5'-3' exonuclease
MDIHAMGIAISEELGKKEHHEQYIRDYIFLCFFLGNDFLPHFPSVHLRTNGLTYLTTMYKRVVKTHGYLISSEGIVWKNVRELIHLLSTHEEEWFQHEHNTRTKYIQQNEKHLTTNDIISSLQDIPNYDRRVEQYINPFEDGWRERYYYSLLQSERTEYNKKQVSIRYLEGLEWTYKYYTFGCPDWEWLYPYNYPPLLCDLKEHVPITAIEYIPFNERQPIHPYVQLAYVLHPSCLHYLPDNIRIMLLQTHPDWYDETRISVEYAYCRYFWEGHVNSPICLSTLQQLIDGYKDTPKDKVCQRI